MGNFVFDINRLGDVVKDDLHKIFGENGIITSADVEDIDASLGVTKTILEDQYLTLA